MQSTPATSFNKALKLCGSGGRGERMEGPSGSRQGGEQEDGLSLLICWLPAWRQGSFEAAPGSTSMAAQHRLLCTMVEWRSLPPSSSATVLRLAFAGAHQPPCCYACLEALSASAAVGSRRPPPSGLVPGGGASGSGEVRRGGDGAGPDGVSSSSFRVQCANCRDLVVISIFLKSLLCNAIAMNTSF